VEEEKSKPAAKFQQFLGINPGIFKNWLHRRGKQRKAGGVHGCRLSDKKKMVHSLSKISSR